MIKGTCRVLTFSTSLLATFPLFLFFPLSLYFFLPSVPLISHGACFASQTIGTFSSDQSSPFLPSCSESRSDSSGMGGWDVTASAAGQYTVRGGTERSQDARCCYRSALVHCYCTLVIIKEPNAASSRTWIYYTAADALLPWLPQLFVVPSARRTERFLGGHDNYAISSWR